MNQNQVHKNILNHRSLGLGIQTNYTYDNTSQLYDYVYAFFYGFVQSINYIYEEKTINIGELSSFTEYTYDYSGDLSNESDYICGSMMLGGNKEYNAVYVASHGITTSHTMTEQGSSFDYFGARYYDSDISVWLSVDPFAFKYPGISPCSLQMNNI